MANQWSKYSFLFKKDGQYFLYSSLSNGFALLDHDTYELLNKVRSGNSEIEIEDEVLSVLNRMHAINVNEDSVVNQIRFLSQKRKFNNESLHLTINPTLACNFNCPYCFEHNHPNIYMTEDVETRIVSFVENKKGIQYLKVMWFGGEPLLGFENIKRLTKKLSEAVPHYSASMISNGYLLTPPIVSCLEYLKIKMIQITLDGLADSHDKKRCTKSGSPTFERIIENISYCLENAPSVHIAVRVNIDNSNPEDYFKVYDYFTSKGMTKVDVVPGFIVDREHDIPTCAFNNRQKVEFMCNLFSDHKIKPISFFPSLSRSSCSARNLNSLVIGPEGELYKCWEDVGRKEYVVGNLTDSSFNRDLMLRYTTGVDQLDDPKCVDCGLLPICDGGCPRVRLLNKYEERNLETCHLIKDGMEDLLYCHYLSKQPTL